MAGRGLPDGSVSLEMGAYKSAQEKYEDRLVKAFHLVSYSLARDLTSGFPAGKLYSQLVLGISGYTMSAFEEPTRSRQLLLHYYNRDHRSAVPWSYKKMCSTIRVPCSDTTTPERTGCLLQQLRPVPGKHRYEIKGSLDMQSAQ
jgi:hypothetical protein